MGSFSRSRERFFSYEMEALTLNGVDLLYGCLGNHLLLHSSGSLGKIVVICVCRLLGSVG